MTGELSRDGYAYRLATVTTDVHAADCGDCARGRCGRGDDLMEQEYREIEAWRQTDPGGADGYDRATWPTT